MLHLSFLTPESVVRVEHLGPHFTKYHLGHGLTLHHLKAPDTGPAHNHPWGADISILSGWYTEDVAQLNDDSTVTMHQMVRRAGHSHRIEAHTVHRITAMPAGEVWTLCKAGPKEQEWGFFEFREDGVWYRQHDQAEFWLKIARA